MFTRHWTTNEDEFLAAHYQDVTYLEIAQILNRSKKAVADRRITLALPPKLIQHPVNVHYFDDIQTYEQAYWLGLLTADGWVGNNQLRLGLKALDSELVLKFRDTISPRKTIRWQKDGKYSMIDIRVTGHLHDILTGKYGIVPQRKATYTIPPSIPDHLLSTFLLGYFDGDGSLSKTKRGYFVWCLCGGLPFIEQVKQIIEAELSLQLSNPRLNVKTKWLYYLWVYAKQQIEQVDAWLHTSGLGLERKKLSYIKSL